MGRQSRQPTLPRLEVLARRATKSGAPCHPFPSGCCRKRPALRCEGSPGISPAFAFAPCAGRFRCTGYGTGAPTRTIVTRSTFRPQFDDCAGLDIRRLRTCRRRVLRPGRALTPTSKQGSIRERRDPRRRSTSARSPSATPPCARARPTIGAACRRAGSP